MIQVKSEIKSEVRYPIMTETKVAFMSADILQKMLKKLPVDEERSKAKQWALEAGYPKEEADAYAAAMWIAIAPLPSI
jgi:hypothetical protein